MSNPKDFFIDISVMIVTCLIVLLFVIVGKTIYQTNNITNSPQKQGEFIGKQRLPAGTVYIYRYGTNKYLIYSNGGVARIDD